MMDREFIVNLLRQELSIENVENITRLGGLTNKTYHVQIFDDYSLVVRLPGEGTEKIINRKDEKISTKLACDLGIDAQLLYFDDNTGIKISKYIDSSLTMNSELLRERKNIVKIAKTLKTLHFSDVDTGVPFDIIDMANKYERFIIQNNGFLYTDYEEVKAYINLINIDYMPKVIRKPCHNDPLCENWILQDDEKMYLIDWEYAGMNDPIWDLADVSIEASYTKEMDQLLLESYFEKELTNEEWKAFQINKVLIDYLWSLWGKTRAVYDGQELEDYAYERYARMKKNITVLNNYVK